VVVDESTTEQQWIAHITAAAARTATRNIEASAPPPGDALTAELSVAHFATLEFAHRARLISQSAK